ncbi:hypothetical protein HWV62_33119 [Athelia sp. TMB]|nr:hypothetical protein HWV62_33119 [Athelia sp. TMB]
MPLELQGFKAWISVDRKETPCYGIEESEDGKGITGWIASEEGKVDGIKCRGVIMDEINFPTDIYYNAGLDTSATTVAPFLFGSVKLTDDDSIVDASLSSRLGDISLSIWRIQLGSVEEFCPEVTPQEQEIHERGMKAIQHRVKLGNEVSSFFDSNSVYCTKDIDSEPLVTFTFKYRPFDVLKANGVAPVPPASDDNRMTVDVPNDEPLSAKIEESEAIPFGDDLTLDVVDGPEENVIVTAPAGAKRKAEQEPDREPKQEQEPIDKAVSEESEGTQAMADRVKALEGDIETYQDALKFCRDDLKKHQQDVAIQEEILSNRQKELKACRDKLEARQAALKARQVELEILKARNSATVSRHLPGFKRIDVSEIELYVVHTGEGPSVHRQFECDDLRVESESKGKRVKVEATLGGVIDSPSI